MIDRKFCPLCNSKNIKNIKIINKDELKRFIIDYYGLSSYEKLRNILDNELIYSECKECKLIFQRNILDDNGMCLLYENIIDPKKSLEKRLNFSLEQNFRSIKFLKNIMIKINKKPLDMTIVDLGMGFGHTLNQAKALGCMNVFGIELSKYRINYAKDNFGIKCFYDLTDFKDESIDLLIANQSLEHIPNIREILDNIEKKLSIGGIVYIAVPDGSKKREFLAKGAFHPLEHINSFKPKSKKCLFSKNLKFIFILRNLHPGYKTTWLFRKIK